MFFKDHTMTSSIAKTIFITALVGYSVLSPSCYAGNTSNYWNKVKVDAFIVKKIELLDYATRKMKPLCGFVPLIKTKHGYKSIGFSSLNKEDLVVLKKKISDAKQYTVFGTTGNVISIKFKNLLVMDSLEIEQSYLVADVSKYGCGKVLTLKRFSGRKYSVKNAEAIRNKIINKDKKKFLRLLHTPPKWLNKEQRIILRNTNLNSIYHNVKKSKIMIFRDRRGTFAVRSYSLPLTNQYKFKMPLNVVILYKVSKNGDKLRAKLLHLYVGKKGYPNLIRLEYYAAFDIYNKGIKKAIFSDSGKYVGNHERYYITVPF